MGTNEETHTYADNAHIQEDDTTLSREGHEGEDEGEEIPEAEDEDEATGDPEEEEVGVKNPIQHVSKNVQYGECSSI